MLELGTGAGKASVCLWLQGLQVELSAKGFSCLVRLFSPPSHWDEAQDSNLGFFNSKVLQMKILHSSVTKARTAGWDTRTSTPSAQSECEQEPEPVFLLL